MTQAQERTATLSAQVAEEIRALLARRRISGRQLANQLGVSPTWVSNRLTGAQTIDLNDLESMARILGVDVPDLLPRPVRSGGLNEISDPTRPDGRPASPEEPKRHAASRPLGPSRRDITRPSSPVPPSRRRPSPVRPGDRVMAA
jgi:transcriptional regulator with XRE-family HTH domain